MANDASRERREVYFSGRVQGIGFRYTVRQLAARYPVTGFVRNLPDGRVEIVVEGPPGDLATFIGEVHGEFRNYIARVEETAGATTGEFRGFDIRF
jgi:acylphosphatase